MPPTAPKPTTETRYARYADAGDGFTTTELFQHEDNETIFEITILTGGTASYTITENPAAQKHAQANADFYLSKTCKYDTSPGGKIITTSPGELRLVGNKWQIKEPAKISFL